MQTPQPMEGKSSVPMISSFLNLCRVCPVPTDDKVNSEYKRNFTWHDGYQSTKVDVIKNAPSLPQSTAEPILPRKKKYPEFGHRKRDLLYDYEEGESSDSLELGGSSSSQHPALPSQQQDSDSKQRITDEDSKANAKHPDEGDSRKLEEKQPLMSQSFPPAAGSTPRGCGGGTPAAPTEEGAGLKTTEYRSQFVAYPRDSSSTRKSASMGLIHAARRADAPDGEVPAADVCPARPEEDEDEAALDAVKRGRIKKTEYKAKFRPFSAYTYVDGSWQKATRLIKDRAADDMDLYSSFSYPLFDGDFIDSEAPAEGRERNAWYSEVVERLKKADQYRVRSNAGVPLYGPDQPPLPLELLLGQGRDRAMLSPVSIASSSRTWKDDRPTKERGRTAIVPVHHRKEKKEYPESPDHLKSREGSTKKKHQLERTTVRPKSAEPTIPVKSEHKSPKRTRPKAPRDLPVHGHGDLSGKKKAYKQGGEKSSPLGVKPKAVSRPGGEEGKVWLKPDRRGRDGGGDDQATMMMNGFSSSPNDDDEHQLVNGEADEHSVQEGERRNGQHVAVTKPPLKVPLTTVRSPEEVTGVRSPDPESWTVPLEIGKGLHWMDGKTPEGVPAKGPPILLSKRLKESSLIGKGQKDIVVCDPDIDNTGESVDL